MIALNSSLVSMRIISYYIPNSPRIKTALDPKFSKDKNSIRFYESGYAFTISSGYNFNSEEFEEIEVSQHKHTMADITDLELPEIDTSNLATKEELTQKANVNHAHNISDITNLQTSLDNKANVNHTHNISDITNLQKSKC